MSRSPILSNHDASSGQSKVVGHGHRAHYQSGAIRKLTIQFYKCPPELPTLGVKAPHRKIEGTWHKCLGDLYQASLSAQRGWKGIQMLADRRRHEDRPRLLEPRHRELG